MVERPFRRSGSGREALSEVRLWSKGPPGGSGESKSPSQWFWSGQEALPEVWECLEAFHEVREWSVGLPGGLGVVGRPSRRFGIGREALPEVRKWSEVVRRSSRRSGSGREALPKDQRWPELVGRPSWRFGSGRKRLGDPLGGPGVVRTGREALPEVLE